jgi:hypothetical protein
VTPQGRDRNHGPDLPQGFLGGSKPVARFIAREELR